MTEQELLELEDRGWRALSTQDAAHDFYEAILDDTAVMLLPGMRLDDRAVIVESMSGQPWSSYELHDAKVLLPAPDVGIVTYRATAQREGSAPYSALISSTYVRKDHGWRLAAHQQTPL